MEKKVFIGYILLITFSISGCGKNKEDSIVKSMNSETLVLTEFSGQDISQGNKENDWVNSINNDEESLVDMESTVYEGCNETMNNDGQGNYINGNNENTRQENVNDKIEGKQNENASLSDIPTIDEDSAQQITNMESNKSLDVDKVNVSLKDITNQKIVIYVENLSEKGITINKIYLMEYMNEQWTEMSDNENRQSILPAYGLAPNGNLEIEYNFVSSYGELSKGKYICAIKIDGELKEIQFEIE